jgi:hypothetical protein
VLPAARCWGQMCQGEGGRTLNNESSRTQVQACRESIQSG